MLDFQTPNAHVTDKNKPAALHAPNSGGKTPESGHHQITQLVAQTFGCYSAHVSLIDKHHQWLDSGHRLDAPKDAKKFAFSAHILNEQKDKLVIQDALNDPIFYDHPWVTSHPFMRAYAGITLYSPENIPMGTLSVIDNKPRLFADAEIETLLMFGRLAEATLESPVLNAVAPTQIQQSVESVAQPFDNFTKAVTDVLEAASTTRMVLGSVDLTKSKSIQNNFGLKVLNECKQELVRRLDLALAGRIFLVGHCVYEGFNFFCTFEEDLDDIKRLSSDLDLNIGRRFQTSQGTVHTSVAIGMTEIGDEETNFHEILTRARVALEDATLTRGSETGISVYRSSMAEQVLRARILATKLEGAIADQEIELYYQPKVRLSDFKVVGAEALLRWQLPDLGFVPPPEIIQAAEDNGMLLQLEMYILELAIKTIAQWHASGIFNGVLSVNISESTLLSKDLETETEVLRSKYQLPANSLEFEILESTLLRDVNTTLMRIHALKLQGISFSLDDFGTGYSSLSHMINLPVDTLKIDRSFVLGIVDDQRGAAMAHQIIGIGRAMKSEIVAEGVETYEEYLILRSLGCDTVQGYYFSKPVTASKFESLVIDHDGAIIPPNKQAKKSSLNAADIINRVGFFAPLSPQGRARLAADAGHHFFRAGTEIVSMGSASEEMYIVVSGVVEIYRTLDNGTIFNFSKLEEDDAFGDIAMLKGKPRTVTARAHSECLLLRIGIESFQTVMRDNPEAAEKIALLMLEGKARRKTTDSTTSIDDPSLQKLYADHIDLLVEN
jgi:EAL domain-containing protein (putative c-di-GMP-specific phosphodiesterase class I)/CRP-like cAMP-binding protein/GGDEF domain-containing protein